MPYREDEALLPLDRFDHPNLHKRPTNVTPGVADRQMNLVLAKQCAGLRHDLRTTGAAMRRAFIRGRFGRNERVSLEWALSGMRKTHFPIWHSLCALTIHELARGLRILGPTAYGYATYLNQWGEDPSKPLPSAVGWTLAVRDFSALPQVVFDMGENDSRRTDIKEFGTSWLDVDGLCYVMPTKALLAMQADRLALRDASGGGPSVADPPS